MLFFAVGDQAEAKSSELAEMIRDQFEDCVKIITRQVDDIGRMVDEFSSFARMDTLPTPHHRLML